MKAKVYKKASPKRENRRASICNTALSLFSKKGYHLTTLKDIADVLDMTHPALYYYYTSKEDLLFDTIKIALTRLVEDIESKLSVTDTKNHADRLFKIAYTQIMHQLEDKGTMPLVDSVLFGPLSQQGLFSAEGRSVLQNLQRQLVNLYTVEIKAGIKAKQFNITDPIPVAFSILGAVSYVVYWYNEDKAYSEKDIAEKVAAFLIKACN